MVMTMKAESWPNSRYHRTDTIHETETQNLVREAAEALKGDMRYLAALEEVRNRKA